MSKRMLVDVYACSDSDNDDVCLIQLAKKKKNICEAAQTYNINPRNSLCRPSQENCEFCDCTFSNRLEALVHNAKHIIIPLLRNSGFNNHEKDSRIENHSKSYLSQTVPSSNNLAILKFNNKIILGNKNKPKPIDIKSRIVFEEDNEDIISISDSDNDVSSDAKKPQTKLTKKDVLSNFVTDCKVVLSDPMLLFNNAKDLEKKSETPNGNENKLLNSFTAECRVALGTPMGFEIETKNTKDGEQKIVTLKRNNSNEKKSRPIENRTQSKEVKIVTLKKKESIEKITHQFENMCLPLDKNKGDRVESRNTVQAADLFSNQNGIKAFNCHIEAMKTQGKEKNITENKRKVIPTQVKEGNDNFEAKTLPNPEFTIVAPVIPKIDETTQKSVHYDELQKPGLYKCDLCKYTFPNRFCIAAHKMGHAKVKMYKLQDVIKKKTINYCKPCQTYFTSAKSFLHHFSQRHIITPMASKPNPINTNKIEHNHTPTSRSKLTLNNISSFMNKLDEGESLHVCTINPVCLELIKQFRILGITKTEIKTCFFCRKEVMECALVSRKPKFMKSRPDFHHNFLQTRLPTLSDIVASSAPIGQNVGVRAYSPLTARGVGSAVFAGQGPAPPLPPLPPLVPRVVPQLNSIPVPLDFNMNGEVFRQPDALVMQRIVPNESEAECVLGF